MIKGVTHSHLEQIWHHLESSDVPYSPNQFLGWDYFCCYLLQEGSSKVSFLWNKSKIMFIQLSKVPPNAAVQFDQSGEKD